MGNKKRIDIDAMKILIEENMDLVEGRSNSNIRSSEIGKNIKRKLVEIPALRHLYEITENWMLRDFIMEHCGLTFKEIAKSGILSLIVSRSDTREVFTYIKEFFKTKEEFVSFVIEAYGIDLDASTEEYKIEDFSYEFKYFAKAMSYIDGACALFLNSNKSAESHKAFYLESIESMAKLNYYNNCIRQGNKNINYEEDLIESFTRKLWLIDSKGIQLFLDRYIKTNASKKEFLMKIVMRGSFSGNSNPVTCMDKCGIVETLESIKGFSEDGFPYKNSENARISDMNIDFTSAFLYFLADEDADKPFTIEQKEKLYNILMKDVLENRPSFDLSLLDTNRIESGIFIKAAFNLAPDEKRDFVFERVVVSFGIDRVIKTLMSFSRNRSSNFYPTVKMTNQILLSEGAYSWNNIIMPEEWFYDIERIRYVNERVYGEYGILFGSDYITNSFVLNRIDLDRIPEEFFTEFYDDIKWRAISRCRRMSVDFMKKHKDSLFFGLIQKNAARKIDEELAIQLLDRDIDMENVANAIRKSKNLSAKFVAENLDRICSFSGSRLLRANPDNTMTLAELLIHI